jgi:hypothetical protein
MGLGLWRLCNGHGARFKVMQFNPVTKQLCDVKDVITALI